MIEFSRSPVNADLGVFVVRNEQTGLWDAACGNDLCGYGLHGVSDDNTSKTAAERAATAHRAHIRSLVAEREARNARLGRIDWEARAVAAEAANARIRGLHRNEYGCCVECMMSSAASVPWPCPTIRALDGIGGVSEQTETAATVDQRTRDVAFNAIQPALAQTGDWLRLTARRNVADAVLAALAEHGRLVFTAEAEQTGGGNV